MNYQKVIEEQIRELQKAQDNIPKNNPGLAETSCIVAETIADLALQLHDAYGE